MKLAPGGAGTKEKVVNGNEPQSSKRYTVK